MPNPEYRQNALLSLLLPPLQETPDVYVRHGLDDLQSYG
jgi:hypothetical protein